ncbi:MAG: tetratricopeptide repeat protein [Nitrospira sp.]|nr:tetratricopeptide repeat protein [Candidatus Manganitrophaceae bacterium]HIL34068.1 tetratricopeptide repeat protein [Candidatus Manganitrophaceae bacterium]
MEDFEQIYEKASVAFDQGKILEAEKLYFLLLEGHPKGYADIYNKLGIIACQKENPKNAVKYFEKALEINPRYTEASLNLAISLNDLGEYDAASKTFSKAAEVVRAESESIDPYLYGKLANEHAKLGDLYSEIGLQDEALAQYRKALSMRPNFTDVLTKFGIALREKGLFDEAIEQFNKAKQVNPKYTSSMVHLGITYYMKGFIDLALKEWEEVQKINPALKEVQSYLSLAKKEVINDGE